MIIFHEMSRTDCASPVTFVCKKDDIDFMQFHQHPDGNYILRIHLKDCVEKPYFYSIPLYVDAIDILRNLASYEDDYKTSLEIFVENGNEI